MTSDVESHLQWQELSDWSDDEDNHTVHDDDDDGDDEDDQEKGWGERRSQLRHTSRHKGK